jgi:predicted ester cyclase
MNAQASKSLVERMIRECQEPGNAALVETFFSADFVDHTPLPGIPPTRDGIAALFLALKAGFPDLRIEILDQVADGGSVATRKRFRGTHGGSFIGIPASGRPLDLTVIDILKVRDGKLTEHWVVVDRMDLLTQLGVVPAPEAVEVAT